MAFYRSQILVCGGTSCTRAGSGELRASLAEELRRRGLDSEVNVIQSGCFGVCPAGPNMMVYPEGVFYCGVSLEDVSELVDEHLVKGRIVERLLYREAETGVAIVSYDELGFFRHQQRIVLRNCGLIDPESIEEYIARDGYLGLHRAVNEMTPDEVIEEVSNSGLRGRGGAGFPTGMKWRFAAREQNDEKYVVCNADEGDPGAFMDRSTVEGDPHALVEGMAIAGYAIGARRGYVYVRAEYPIAISRLRLAIDRAREAGLLGEGILGSAFGFDLEIRLGAGAFVCGEETALLHSVMGKRGEPRPRPPFPTTSGLWGKPTVINNVETLANIPAILRNGWEWFAGTGSEKSKGTKVFALAGKVNNNGLIEVPIGTPLGEIIFDIGGGIPKGRKFKAAQTGGPSGGCIPRDHLNTPIDYESLAELGSIMGSGGLIVLDEDTCMVDLAKFFLEFVQEESCGKCVPCRVGTERMLEILDRITLGRGEEGDIEKLEALARAINESALCGLGQTAPNPVLSTLKYFREEYEAHIKDKRCPASVCAALFTSPCQNTCPTGIDVPLYIDLVREARFADAYELIRRDNPFPSICGRVCHHPCEGRCRREQIDQAVAIRALKRVAGDFTFAQQGGPVAVPPTTELGKAVAVIGAGPAGLTAAHFLRKKGYKVTVFEKLPVAGGMMVMGIPEYRLPRDVVKAEIGAIEDLGVEIKTGVEIGKDLTIEELRDRGYEAVFIGVGAWTDHNLGIPGEELEGVVSGVDFLRDLHLERPLDVKGKRVVVIGGGNVAVDAARSALRLGAAETTILYRRRHEDMPALRSEIEDAVEEGVDVMCLVVPSRVVGRAGKVSAVECVRLGLGEFDASGRRRPIPEEGSHVGVEADIVIRAIGQTSDTTALKSSDVEMRRGHAVMADGTTQQTSEAGIFAGGDCVTGPATLIEAIAAGKRAAAGIDRYLGGDGRVVDDMPIEREIKHELLENSTPRVPVRKLDPAERTRGSDEVELCYLLDQAVEEARRCLRCDVD